jgi:hypothetical protein
MPMTLEVNPPKATLTIGDDYAQENTIKFTIALNGNGTVWLTLRVPIGENGVLRKAEDANQVKIETPGTHPDPELKSQNAEVIEWKLGDYGDGVQVNGAVKISVAIGNILCRANEGTSQLTVTCTDESQATLTQDVEIAKAKPTKAPDNPILYFVAEPTFLIDKDYVKLSWDLAGGQKATLKTPSGVQSPDASFYKDILDKTWDYALSVGDIKKERYVTVNVLTEGWQKVFALGRPNPKDKDNRGPYPSVIFDPDDPNGDALYAILVRRTKPRLEAVLCKSVNGITDWQVMSPNVPKGMESSPGVQLGNRLWLIGGSAVDPEQISNRVWYFDLEAPEKNWQEARVEGFQDGERMGHACLAVDDKTIWMLGGLDKYHKCTNDLWQLTISDPEQTEQRVNVTASKTSCPWPKRCMFSAVKHDDTIWVFGGVDSPNGNAVGDLWTSSGSPGNWKRIDPPKELRDAIGTGAATTGSGLFALLRTQELEGKQTLLISDQQLHLTNVTASSLTWERTSLAVFKINDPWNGWTSNAHSIGVVGFQKRLYLRFLHPEALYADDAVSAPIFVYVN